MNIEDMTLEQRLEEINKKMSKVTEPRENIIKLGEKITNRIGLKAKATDPEYWGLDLILSDELADMLLLFKLRKPYTRDELLELTKKSEEDLDRLLDEASIIGMLEYNWENPQREKQWVLPLFVPGSAEFTNMVEQNFIDYPDIGIFFERMARLALENVTEMIPMGGAGIGLHVIPVEKAIEAENTSIDIEHISHWLKKYDGQYAASPCSCRMSRESFNEGCGDDYRDWCIGVGDMANYVVETQKGGHYVTYDEVLEILKKAEDNGFVHQITNIDGENKIFAICNCNVDVCYALRTSQLFNTPNLSRSAYIARVNPDNCVACGRCVEYCPAGAVKLGQKLNTEDGPIKYPLTELPDKVKWGPERWNENYRNDNRKPTYDTGTAPCKVACPANIAVQGYLQMAKEGKYTDALALIKKNNPFPAVCGRICNKVCEDECTRNVLDDPVSIDEVKKFIAEQDLHESSRYIPEPVIPSLRGRWKDKIAIIGAGPAGLSCAYYLAEMGYNPTVFEKNNKPGGMLTYGVPDYKLPKDVIDAEIDIIREMGVEIVIGVEVGKDITIDQLREDGYKAFYLAIGCQGGRKANIPGEDGEGVYTAVDFLREVHNYKMPNLKGKVVVIGGGNVAIDSARSALRVGAEDVSIYSLESREELPASEQEILESELEDIKLNHRWGPKRIILDSNKVIGVEFKKCISVFDDNEKFNPIYDENDTITVDADYVIMGIGQKVVWKDLLKNTDVELINGQYPVFDKLTFQTDEEDIFIGGDLVSGPSFAINAIATGKEGAISLHRFVRPKSSLTIGRRHHDFIMLDKDKVVIDSYDHAGRQEPEHKKERIRNANLDFSDQTELFTPDQMKLETNRCLSCGSAVVDVNRCIGCGVCTTKCNFDAIKLYREHPKASRMVKAEDKAKAILPYALKRKIKIAFNRGKSDPKSHTLIEQSIPKRP